MNKPNNPMAQFANLLNVVEAHLRRATHDNVYIGLAELREHLDVIDAAKDAAQIKHVLKVFRERGHLIQQGMSRWAKYQWDTNSPPFLLDVKLHKKAQREPSEAAAYVPAPKPAKPQKVHVEAVDKDVELIVNGHTFVIGVNPDTGRPRIMLDF